MQTGQPWAERWIRMIAEHAQTHPTETPREALAREHARFEARAPVREVVEHFEVADPVCESWPPWWPWWMVARTRLSCGHVRAGTDAERVRCTACYAALAAGPGQQAAMFGEEEQE